MGLKVLHGVLIACCLAGVLVAALAYGEHLNTGTSPCQINATWDCGIVNHSPFAVLHGIPVALIGVVGYGLLIALVGRAPWFLFWLALGGFAFSLRFTYVEWRVLQVWCLYCVSSQAIITAVAGLSFFAARQPARGRG